MTPHYYVWAAGVSRWTQVSQLHWLYGHQQVTLSPAPISPYLKQGNHTSNKLTQTSKKSLIAPIAIIIIALALFYIFGSLVYADINRKNFLNSKVYALAAGFPETPNEIVINPCFNSIVGSLGICTHNEEFIPLILL